MKLTDAQWAGIAAGVAAVGAGLYYIFFSGSQDESIDGGTADVGTEDDTQPDSPAALAAGAGVALNVYALARAIASESGGSPRTAQAAVGWTIVNYAHAHFGGDVTKAILGSAATFGRQGSGGRHYVSSARAPMGSQLTLAAQILNGGVGDPTGGATNFDSPREQQRELDAGQVSKGPDEVAAEREGSGLVAYDVDVSGADFRFWGPV